MSGHLIIPDTPEKEHKLSESSDNEHDPHYPPIISLPEVHVSTNEEEEAEFMKIRAKLYRFDSVSDPPEWKERGTGELKMLRHKEKSSFRIVMRRDKTLKVCANHFITPWMDLKASSTSERAFIYTVPADFADEKTKSECLAVKFANIENANIFKSKFEEAKKILLKDCELYNGKVDNDIDRALNKANYSLNSEDEDEENKRNDSVKEEQDTTTNEISKKLSQLEVNKSEVIVDEKDKDESKDDVIKE